MFHDKVPRRDGFPVDFYMTFNDTVCPLLLDTYNNTLNYKKGKDDFDLRSYRPISPLNCDQKILATILSGPFILTNPASLRTNIVLITLEG